MMSEQAPTEKPKRKRVYKGEELERKRAYMREYNRKLRAKEKAAKHRPLKPIEIAQLKRVPLHKVANEGSKEEMARFGQKWQSQTRDIAAYRALLEQERVAAGNDWNEQSKSHFDKLMKG
jgi:hypothetical protein